MMQTLYRIAAVMAVMAAAHIAMARGAESELTIDNGGRHIYGILSRASSPGGIAIISHGFNGTHHFGRDYFDTLDSIGYSAYTFDYPCGSLMSRSDSNTMEMSVLDQKNDLKAIVRHFKAQSPDAPVVLIGESQGGLVTALAAAELGDTVSAVVLIYPALCIPDNWNSRYRTEADIPDTTKVWQVPIGRRFFTELRDIDVDSAIAAYQGPVLIIHGAKDNIVPVGYSMEACKHYHDARLRVLPAAGHGFNPADRALSNSYVKKFLKK